MVKDALGALALFLVVTSLAGTAIELRRTVVPRWRGASARLAEVVLGYATAVVLLQLLGLLGLLVRPAIVGGAVLLLALAHLVRRRVVGPVTAPLKIARLLRPAGIPGWLAVGGVVLVSAQWLASAILYARNGIDGYDSLHYHLTFAAHFARDSSILPIHRLDALAVTVWYPLNNELVLGSGMVLLGGIALTFLVDLLVLAAVLLSSWVLGARYAAGPHAVLAACVLLASLGPKYAGSADNDWSATWPLLAAVALLAAGRESGRISLAVVALAGLAGGLSVGTKLVVLAPVAVVFLLTIALARGQRLLAVAVSLGGHLLTGGYWYLRDLAVTGSPVPNTKVGIGSWQLPLPANPQLDKQSFSVLDYVGDGQVIRDWFVPGLRGFFGPACWLILALVVLGIVLSMRDRADRLLVGAGLAAAASIVLWVVTPTSAGGGPGNPVNFQSNIRYALVGWVLGLVLLAIGAARGRWQLCTAVLLAVLLLVTMGRSAAWTTGFSTTAVLLVVVLAVSAVVMSQWKDVAPRLLAVLAVVAIAGAAAVTVPVDRHVDTVSYRSAFPRIALFAAVRQLHGERVGIVGVPQQFPLFGPKLTNEVTYLGETRADDSFRDIFLCSDLLAEVKRHRISVVVVQPYPYKAMPDVIGWLRHDPGTHELLANSAGSVFRISPAASAAHCA